MGQLKKQKKKKKKKNLITFCSSQARKFHLRTDALLVHDVQW